MPRRVKVGPAGLEPPAGARKRRKASAKKRRNTTPGFKALDPNFLKERIFHLILLSLLLLAVLDHGRKRSVFF